MEQLFGYRRKDGNVGIRNHLFVLPAVVCANQVAIDVARNNERLKYIEHQHGCAQIGRDLAQTQRVFSNLGIHPNAYASMFVGLGCEGIMAQALFRNTRERTEKPMELVMIQDVGGTLAAKDAVEDWVAAREEEIVSLQREEIAWNDLTVGLLLDDDAATNQPQVEALVAEMLTRGTTVIVPTVVVPTDGRQDARTNSLESGLLSAAPAGAHTFGQTGHSPDAIEYGELASRATRLGSGAGTGTGTARGEVVWMGAGSNPLETATGLTAGGAHVIIHIASKAHGFGIPLVPVVRFASDEVTYKRMSDDFDGCLAQMGDTTTAMAALARIINGEPSAAEDLGMDDFAMYRIGPTV